jgi:hypothetical protein
MLVPRMCAVSTETAHGYKMENATSKGSILGNTRSKSSVICSVVVLCRQSM